MRKTEDAQHISFWHSNFRQVKNTRPFGLSFFAMMPERPFEIPFVEIPNNDRRLVFTCDTKSKFAAQIPELHRPEREFDVSAR